MEPLMELNVTAEEMQTESEIDKWLFMSSPYPILFILAFYASFVLKLGPYIMQNRQPFKLKGVMFVYNFYQVLCNSWIFMSMIKLDFMGVVLKCDISHVDKYVAASLTWLYFFSKVMDLLDTVFFVLRKKQSQVTFLHVYHHFMMVAFSWYYVKFLPNGQGAFMGLVNSFVHIVMYIYYFLAGLGPKYQKYLWWKRYITRLQLIQFSLVMLYLVYLTVMGCNLPAAVIYFYLFNDVLFIYLFLDFYRNTYKKKRSNLNDSKVPSKMH